MPDVNVTQNQVNVTPDTSTLSITTSPVEVTVQQSATPSVDVDTSKNIVEVTQPTAEVVVALATGPQGPAGSGGGVTSYSELSDIPSGIISSSLHIFTAITSSGEISASGDVYAESIILPFGQAINFGSHDGNHMSVNSGTGHIIFDTLPVQIQNGLEVLGVNGHITASGNVIVEGNIKTKLDGGSF